MRIFHTLKKHKLIVIVLLIIISGLIYYFRPQSSSKIEVQSVKRGDIIESLSATGSVDAEKSVNLNFIAGGKLVFLGIKKGDSVKAGQTIAVLDQRSMQKNLEASLKDYWTQRLTFDQTIANNNNIPNAQNALNDNMKRILQNNQNDLEKSVLSVELQSLAKEQSVLSSPISGIVTKTDVTTTGVNISPTTSFTIADPSSLMFKVEIDEADIGKVRIGEPMNITLDAYPDQKLNTTVYYIDFTSHKTDTGGDAYTVQANLIQNNGISYRIGMNGDADLISNEKNGVLIIPLSSITNDSYVYVKNSKGFEKRNVTIGLKNDTDAEVIEGVKEGEEVALDPSTVEKTILKISPTP